MVRARRLLSWCVFPLVSASSSSIPLRRSAANVKGVDADSIAVTDSAMNLASEVSIPLIMTPTSEYGALSLGLGPQISSRVWEDPPEPAATQKDSDVAPKAGMLRQPGSNIRAGTRRSDDGTVPFDKVPQLAEVNKVNQTQLASKTDEANAVSRIAAAAGGKESVNLRPSKADFAAEQVTLDGPSMGSTVVPSWSHATDSWGQGAPQLVFQGLVLNVAVVIVVLSVFRPAPSSSARKLSTGLPPMHGSGLWRRK